MQKSKKKPATKAIFPTQKPMHPPESSLTAKAHRAGADDSSIPSLMTVGHFTFSPFPLTYS